MIKYILTLIFVLLLINFNASAQIIEETPLNNYLKIAAENNPELKSIFNQYLAALERLPQAKALPDPTVVFSVFTSPVETRVGAQQAGISLNQAFPWFGQLKSQENVVAQLAKARFEFFEDKKNELFFNVRSLYYELYVLEAAISITKENIGLLKSFQELANVKLESGKGGAVDLLRVEMDLAELENDLSFLNDSRLPIKAKFRELLNTESVVDISLPDTLSPIDFQEGKNILIDSVIIQNPSLKKFDFEINALDSEIDVAEKMGLPSFNLGLSYTNIKKRNGVDLPDNGKDVFMLPRIGVRLPIYRKKYLAMVKERQLLKTAKSNEKENRINQLTTKLEKAWRDYNDAKRRVGLYLNLINLANQSLDILAAQYTSAGTDFEEMLRMDRQLLRYELELEKARADQNTTVAFINYLTGKKL